MILQCESANFETILEIINDGAPVYKGIIPEDRWHEPYMSREHLQADMNDGVVFWGFTDTSGLSGVMGIQAVHDVTLIRHAYVRTRSRNQGIGARLLRHLRTLAQGSILIGTWADAVWATRFYQNNGFALIEPIKEKDRLLRKYWKIPERQVETSIVLSDQPSPRLTKALGS